MKRFVRWAYLAVAAVTFCLALAGVVLPGLPATPFLLLTSFLLVRSYPKLNDRLLRLRFVGPLLTDWQEHRGVRRHVKIKALVLIAAALAMTASSNQLPIVWLDVVMLCGICGVATIWQLPEVSDTHVYRGYGIDDNHHPDAAEPERTAGSRIAGPTELARWPTRHSLRTKPLSTQSAFSMAERSQD